MAVPVSTGNPAGSEYSNLKPTRPWRFDWPGGEGWVGSHQPPNRRGHLSPRHRCCNLAHGRFGLHRSPRFQRRFNPRPGHRKLSGTDLSRHGTGRGGRWFDGRLESDHQDFVNGAPVLLGAVGRPGARNRVRSIAGAAGYCEGSDFFCVA